jgi:hypothetical protein
MTIFYQWQKAKTISSSLFFFELVWNAILLPIAASANATGRVEILVGMSIHLMVGVAVQGSETRYSLLMRLQDLSDPAHRQAWTESWRSINPRISHAKFSKLDRPLVKRLTFDRADSNPFELAD